MWPPLPSHATSVAVANVTTDVFPSRDVDKSSATGDGGRAAVCWLTWAWPDWQLVQAVGPDSGGAAVAVLKVLPVVVQESGALEINPLIGSGD